VTCLDFRFQLRLGGAFLLGSLGLIACGDDGGGGSGERREPSNAEEVAHRRRCDERCDDEQRCSAEALPPDFCRANCDEMLPDPECRDLHADYVDCLDDPRIGCEQYDIGAQALCDDEFRAFFVGCEPWQDAEEARPDPNAMDMPDGGM